MKIVDFSSFYFTVSQLIKNMVPKVSKKMETILIFLLIPLVGFIFDYTSKQAIIENICVSSSQITILPFFNIVCVLNTGVSFGMMSSVENGKAILLVLTTLILVFIYFLTYKEKDKFVQYCYSVIIAGAFGNIIDRAINGGVIDFLDFHYKHMHYPAFNVADSLIFIGVFGIIIRQLTQKKQVH